MNLKVQSNEFWEKIELDSKLVKDTIDHAKKDLATAKKMDSEESDWCYAIAYNGMLQAARALMYNNGLRPKGEAKHFAVVEYLRKNYSDNLDLKDVINVLDRSRKKRHRIVYEERGLISREEATHLISVAEKFIKFIEKII